MTHLIFSHVYFDAATDAFIAAMSSLCHTGDSFSRVDQNVIAPKGSPGAVYLGRFADFDQPAFVTLVSSIPWEFVSGITAFIRQSGQKRFESVKLNLAFDIGRDFFHTDTRRLLAPHGLPLFHREHRRLKRHMNHDVPQIVERHEFRNHFQVSNRLTNRYRKLPRIYDPSEMPIGSIPLRRNGEKIRILRNQHSVK